MSDNKNTGTQIPPQGTGTSVPPPAGTGTRVPPRGTGTAVPPSGTGTAVPPSGTGTAVPPAGTGTAVSPGAPGSSAPIGGTALIPEYDEYVIKGIRYRVLPDLTAKTLAKKSGEAKIFVVENGGRKFVIKLYMPGHSPNHVILDEVQKAKGGFMIDLYDHGRWDDPGHQGLTLDYEVMAYAPYGSLADMKLRGDEKKFRDVAWRMAFCIKQCHDHRILHRDIKPENFLFTDPEHTKFVITDFGIARSITGRGPVKVDTAKSSYFVSPEGSMSSKDRTTYVDRPTDYYSMGMTLLALWIGLDNFYSLFPYDQLEELDRLKLNNKVISEIGDDMLGMTAYSRSLLERLLEAGDESRADFDEIKRWYEGETLKTGSAAEAATSKSAFNVTFDETKGKVAHSREELARMMMEDPEFAKSFIYRGMARAALQGSFPRLAADIDDIPQRLYPRPDEQAVGVYAACLLLDPTIPFIGRKQNKCNTPKEIAAELATNTDYYATELAKKASMLWAFLRTRGDQVKGFPEKFQPMIARSGGHGVFALCKALNPEMRIKDRKGNSIADIPALTRYIWDNRVSLAKELGNPDHMVWTYLASFGPNAASLSRSYPAKIKQGGVSEIFALCLNLDKKMPYYGKSNNPCSNEKAVADELWSNFAAYCKELSDPNHQLWKYMRLWNDSWRSVADTYPALIAKHADNYLFKLIYLLDGTKPFTIRNPKTKSVESVSNFDELVASIAKNGTTGDTLKTFSQECFITWLRQSKREEDRKRAGMVEDIVKKFGSSAEDRGWFILYSLAPKAGMFMYENQDYTPAQLGKYLNDEAKGVDGVFSSFLYSPDKFQGCRMYQYMLARKMDQYIMGINKIIDVPANIAAHKSAPYDHEIARYKVIEYLGAKPSFTFPQSKTVATSLDDVKRVSQSERDACINKGLAAFLTIFFHEGKNATFSLEKLKDYYDFIAYYCPAHTGMQRSRAARQRVSGAVSARDKAWRSLRLTSRIVTWLCLVPMVAIVAWMIVTAFTDGSADLKEAFMAIGKFIAIGLAIVGGICGAEGGIFGIIIGALIGYWVPYWIFSLLSGIAPFILAGLVIFGAIWCIRKMHVSKTDQYIPTATDYNNLRKQADLYVMCEAFGTTQRTFGSNSSSVDPTGTFNLSEQAATGQRSQVRKAALWMILLTIITLVIGVSLYKTVDRIESGEYATAGMAVPADLPGTWSGTFHGRTATMALQLTDGTDVEGSVLIQYSTPMTQTVKGSLSYGELTLEVTDVPGATYSGKVTSDDNGVITYTGVYNNPRKGTRHDFTFTHVGTSTAAAQVSDDGFTTTDSGLQYKILRKGSGKTPGPTSKVRVNYEGRLLDGTVFDQSPAGEPVQFGVADVVPGFAEGLQLMKSGGKAIFRIPSSLAYGSKGVPQVGIGPDTDIEFEVELLSVTK